MSSFLGKFAFVVLALSSVNAFADRRDHDGPRPPSPVMEEIQCTEMRPEMRGRAITVTVSFSRRSYEASISTGRHMLGFFNHLEKVQRMGATQYLGRDFNLNVAMGSRGQLFGTLEATTDRFERITARGMRCNLLR